MDSLKTEILAIDAQAFADLLDTARQVVLDEASRCQAAFRADAEERQSQRASAAQRRHPDAPWRWYQDPDVAVMEQALARLPTGDRVREIFVLDEDAVGPGHRRPIGH